MRAEPLSDIHDLTTFESGEPSLDVWLRDHARTAEAKRTSRTFVWRRGDRVLGYYSLTAHRLVREELPRRLAHGSPREVPAVLLGKLALDVSVQGKGEGGVLLADALTRAYIATTAVAARFVVVDALHDKAASFYEHYGFRRIPEPRRDPAATLPDPVSSCRLAQKVSDVGASLGLA